MTSFGTKEIREQNVMHTFNLIIQQILCKVSTDFSHDLSAVFPQSLTQIHDCDVMDLPRLWHNKQTATIINTIIFFFGSTTAGPQFW